MPRILRIYAKYLAEIFNDSKNSIILSEKATKLENYYQQKSDQNYKNISDIIMDGKELGIVIISSDEVNNLKYN